MILNNEATVKAKFTNRLTIGFTDDQITFLNHAIEQGEAEDIASLIRRYVNIQKRQTDIVSGRTKGVNI